MQQCMQHLATIIYTQLPYTIDKTSFSRAYPHPFTPTSTQTHTRAHIRSSAHTHTRTHHTHAHTLQTSSVIQALWAGCASVNARRMTRTHTHTREITHILQA
jgi:hypothetical protein